MDVKSEPVVVYRKLCPQCGLELTVEEVEKGVCFKKRTGLCRFSIDERVREFLEFFKKVVGDSTSLQKMWARRVIAGESFAAVAPTGVGKTTFGLAMAAFLATRGKRCYLIFPTSLLAEQSYRRFLELCSRAGIRPRTVENLEEQGEITVLYYRSRMKKSEKEKFFEALEKREDDVLITTSQFLARNFSRLKCCYNFIFVDDVDSILKASRNVDRILQLLGFRFQNGEWTGKARGVLMVSTATAKKGEKVRLFRELLNFDVGSSHHTIRNVEDVLVERDDTETVKEIMRKMGEGGIIYAKSVEDAEKLYSELKDEFRIGLVSGNAKEKAYEGFEKGELDYLVGTSYYYGTLVRGLDLPERIKFAIFVGAPAFTVRVEDVDSVSPRMLRILKIVFGLPEEMSEEESREKLKELIAGDTEVSTRDVCFRKGEVVFPDLRTYIQGSGRTSRLFAGGITKGASFLLESDGCVRRAFVERAKHFDIEFKGIDEVNFEKLKEEIEESRKGLRKEVTDVIKPALFIVESPTKAKQISRFFGRPSVKALEGIIAYEVPAAPYVLSVSASLGHVTDLTTEDGFHGVRVEKDYFIPVYSSIKRCRECGYQFTSDAERCPKCEGEDIDDSALRIASLRKLAHDAGIVIIGTDPDSEGEKIAWDLSCLLSNCGKIMRAEFHEITPKAVINALNNLREVDRNLVKAQVVRRVEDRWIGFELSQKLWRVFGSRNLSAGRAQTPVLGWIIERYEEHRKKKKILILRELGISVDLSEIESDKSDLLDWKAGEKKKLKVTVNLVERREEERTPLPPYTTDSMLRDANAILKMSAAEAMRIAQELFESGLITYHRTDSTRVSEAGWRVAREWLGDDFQAREWYAEGAHECIRPTRPVDRDTLRRLIQEGVIMAEGMTWRHFALYDLIFRRFMASQCRNYRVTVEVYDVCVSGVKIREERIVKAEGKAYELYRAVRVRDPLPEGEIEVSSEIRLVPFKPLLTQSEVIQMMRERGIGRPSTYSTIIEKLFQRGYIVEKNGKLIPTKRGIEVYDYLSRNYSEFVSEERTRKLEEKMDAVERGDVNYMDVLRELYEEIKSISQ